MSKLYATDYDEPIENFSFGSNVVNDELYTNVIYYIAAHKPTELFDRPVEELSQLEQSRLRKYEDIDLLKELLERHYNGTEEEEDYDTLCIFARNVTPFKLMEFHMSEEQFDEAKDRVISYFSYDDDGFYSYDKLDTLIAQHDDNYLMHLYTKTKIDHILETTTRRPQKDSKPRIIRMNYKKTS